MKQDDPLLNAALRYFNERGPVSALKENAVGRTDELSIAARAVAKGGKHEGPCQRAADGHCKIHVRTFLNRENRLREIVVNILNP